MAKNIMWAGENPEEYTREIVGGKGLNLLRLHELAEKIDITVPDFFIIPLNAKKHFCSTDQGTGVVYESEEIQKAFEKLKKPVAVRSSSPLEDGVNATFAGLFETKLDIDDYDAMCVAANQVYESAYQGRASEYAEKMGVEFDDAMALIIQEQVIGFLEIGVIQLEEDKAIQESSLRGGRINSNEMKYRILDMIFPKDVNYPYKPEDQERDRLSAWESDYAIYCARRAKNLLGMEGVVQVEYFLAPGKKPVFVQIRQLPKVISHAFELDMDVPEGVPCIESDICNGVPGELALPAYVTVSQSGLKRILIGTGQAAYMGFGSTDERMERFSEGSKLAFNGDFLEFLNLVMLERIEGLQSTLPLYTKLWETGNGLFPEYILVCDKLDETISKMTDATTNKRAIITCLEANKTSHAMTVARDLGIMAMGVEGDIMDMGYFFNQVETGDIIHMKSNGKKAVAYIQRKGEKDPYS